jgi:hypothetical protein
MNELNEQPRQQPGAYPEITGQVHESPNFEIDPYEGEQQPQYQPETQAPQVQPPPAGAKPEMARMESIDLEMDPYANIDGNEI